MIRFASRARHAISSPFSSVRETTPDYESPSLERPPLTPDIGPTSEASEDPGPGAVSDPGLVPEPGGAPGGDVVPDPFADADALEELEDEIATLAAHIHAATHRLLVLIGEFDRREGWKLGGHRSCAHWLHVRTGIALGAAREKVRAARALVHLPRTSASMARGELSFSKVRCLTRVATVDNETDLLELARDTTTAQLERMVRAFRRGTREDEATQERRRHESRTLSVFPDEDGMYVIRGRLEAEVGALLMRAVEAAGDVLYREKRIGWRVTEGEDGRTRAELRERAAETEKEVAQRRADALGLLAERAMAVGFWRRPGGSRRSAGTCECQSPGIGSADRGADLGANQGASRCADRGAEAVSIEGADEGTHACGDAGASEGADVSTGQGSGADSGQGSDADSGQGSGAGNREGADACIGADAGTEAEAWTPVPISGSRAERYQVVLHVEAQTLQPQGDVGRSDLEDGTRVSAETSRRLSCDAGLVRVQKGPDGSVLDVARKTRTIPPALRRALEVRDGGCRFPGCGLRFCDGHHVKHWAEGGETSLDNCVLLCRYHHRLIHEGGWTMGWWGPGQPVFYDPRGGTHFEGRNMPKPGKRELSTRSGKRSDLVPSLLRENRRRGANPHGRTAGARWEREDDIPDHVLFRAQEALFESG